jgi:DNA processing protein
MTQHHHLPTNDTLEAWLMLWRAQGIGAKNFNKLIDAFGSAQNVLDAAKQQKKSSLLDAGLNNRTLNALCKHALNADLDLEWLESSDKHHIITLHDPRYPTLLKTLTPPPPILFVNGTPDYLNDPQIAIVGSRNPTQSGKDLAHDFAKHLGTAGFCITSGLALGIDGKAHEGALAANAPTIAVTATGLDRVYPARHRSLAHQIVEQGAIISEFPIGTEARPQHFPQRNRIISGLSIGTLIVEAAIRSGSLLTAQHALEQGREVFAIPGSIHNPLARGCHHLIRQGAKLVETADHILEEIATILDFPEKDPDILAPQVTESAQETMATSSPAATSSLDNDYQHLLTVMEFDPITVDQLILRSGLTADTISSMLLMLELQGWISANGGGTYSRIK